MRVFLIVAWLFIGLGGMIYHFGPGQEKLERDRIGGLIRLAQADVRQQDWRQAVDSFDAVLAQMPAEKLAESRMINLEKAKAQMMAAQLPEAREALEALLHEVASDPSADTSFVADVQSTLASSQYFNTWLMRLEGAVRDDWMPEIESARQHYSQLAKRAESQGDQQLLNTSLENLESSIRLARMDLSELQALPLPSQCQGCCSCQRKGKMKQKVQPQPNAGHIEVPDGQGS